MYEMFTNDSTCLWSTVYVVYLSDFVNLSMMSASAFHFFADFPNCAFMNVQNSFFLYFLIDLLKYLVLFLSKQIKHNSYAYILAELNYQCVNLKKKISFVQWNVMKQQYAN